MDKPTNDNYPHSPGEGPVFEREADEEQLKEDAYIKTGGLQSWYTKKELTKTGNYGKNI